jgi:hypothetical protein
MEESIVDHKVVSQRAPMGEYVKSSFGDLQRDNINAHWMVARSWLLTEMGKELPIFVCMQCGRKTNLCICFFTLLDRDKGEHRIGNHPTA